MTESPQLLQRVEEMARFERVPARLPGPPLTELPLPLEAGVA